MNLLRMTIHQVKYENRAFWRNPPAAFFTVGFPLICLVIFNLLFGSNEIQLADGTTVHTSTFYIPAISALSVISSCYTNIAIRISFARDHGLLKRTRGTPLRGWVFFVGRIVHATLIALFLITLVTIVGKVFYNVAIPTNTMPAFLVTVGIGAMCFSVLGLAITAAIPSADASPAIVNASILPLFFISDIFIPLNDVPEWLTTIANVFPVRHFSLALQTVFNPNETGFGFEWIHLSIIAIWTIICLLITTRSFRWEPRQ